MAGRIPDSPFVLLDDARASHAAPARLYRDPLEVVTATDAVSLHALLDRLAAEGGHWAGFLTYEAGLLLEDRLAARVAPAALPLAWFGRFDGFEEIAADQVADLLPSPEGGWAGAPRPLIARPDYDAALARVQALIAAGDIYQANLTIRAEVSTAGHPLALYAGLRARAKAGFGGVIWTGQDWMLSLSPELFFALHDGAGVNAGSVGHASGERWHRRPSASRLSTARRSRRSTNSPATNPALGTSSPRAT